MEISAELQKFVADTTTSSDPNNQASSSAQYVGSIDVGTTSSRFILFDKEGDIKHIHQLEQKQHYPQAGWCEHDVVEILDNVRTCIKKCVEEMGGSAVEKIAAVGITNQRETTVVWDKNTGKPYYKAIVWHDARTGDIVRRFEEGEGEGFPERGIDRFRAVTGLPLATYFSAMKLIWILENVEGVREAAEAGDALFGTIDTWMLWNLTGGVNGGLHATDVSNASRTLMMSLENCQWDEGILECFNVPKKMLPKILSSSEIYGKGDAQSGFEGIPLSGILGDQQAALFGQTCFTPGEGKNTYGTGCFFMINSGDKILPSKSGLLTTVAYKIGNGPTIYALEGSVAIAGALIQWLRDNLQMITKAPEVEKYAKMVEDSGDVFIVPAFGGLFAPRWRRDARGVIVGLTSFSNRNHICRAAIEAVCYQAREVVEAMEKDGTSLTAMKVDGGMTANETMLQFQSDILGAPVIRPKILETTALGAAYAAGLAVGFWKDGNELRTLWGVGGTWNPKMSEADRDAKYKSWNKAVERSFGWAEDKA